MPNISDKRQSGMFAWFCRIMEGGMAMDIRLIGQKTVLSAYTARPAENAGKGSPAPAASAPSPVGDTLVLSRSVQDLYRQTEENLAKELLNPEQSGNEGDALTSGMDVQLRCSKIAARIRAGDKVPLKDQQYLLKNNPDLYNLAMIARRAKEHPKKWDSLVPKENKEESPGESTAAAEEIPSSGGTEAPSAETGEGTPESD